MNRPYNVCIATYRVATNMQYAQCNESISITGNHSLVIKSLQMIESHDGCIDRYLSPTLKTFHHTVEAFWLVGGDSRRWTVDSSFFQDPSAKSWNHLHQKLYCISVSVVSLIGQPYLTVNLLIIIIRKWFAPLCRKVLQTPTIVLFRRLVKQLS